MITIPTGDIFVYDASLYGTMGEAMDDYDQLARDTIQIATTLADPDNTSIYTPATHLQLIANALAMAHLAGIDDIPTTVMGILWTMGAKPRP